jgi:hypothetical protein
MLPAPVWYLTHDADAAGDKATSGWPARARRVRPPAPCNDWTEAFNTRSTCAAGGRTASGGTRPPYCPPGTSWHRGDGDRPLATRPPASWSINRNGDGSRSLTILRNAPPLRGSNNRFVFRRDPFTEIECSFLIQTGGQENHVSLECNRDIIMCGSCDRRDDHLGHGRRAGWECPAHCRAWCHCRRSRGSSARPAEPGGTEPTIWPAANLRLDLDRQFITVIWEEVSDDPRMIYPGTAYEVPPPQGRQK